MPGKGRRVASRQAQLGQRRKKQQRGPSVPPSAGAEPASVQPQANGTVGTRVRDSDAPVAPARSAPVAPSRNPARARLERPAVYNYIGAEVLRILILSGIVLVVLIILAFVL